MEPIKCEFCDSETGEKCVFATVKRVIDGKEHFFCSVRHADSYEKHRAESEERRS